MTKSILVHEMYNRMRTCVHCSKLGLWKTLLRQRNNNRLQHRIIVLNGTHKKELSISIIFCTSPIIVVRTNLYVWSGMRWKC